MSTVLAIVAVSSALAALAVLVLAGVGIALWWRGRAVLAAVAALKEQVGGMDRKLSTRVEQAHGAAKAACEIVRNIEARINAQN